MVHSYILYIGMTLIEKIQ